MVRTYNLKTGVFNAETGENIDHRTPATTAISLHGTHGIALIQHPNEACYNYISSRIRVGTNNHFNHSTMTTIALLCLAEHAVCQQFLSCIGCMRASYTCRGHCLDLTGWLHNWNYSVCPTRIMVTVSAKSGTMIPFGRSDGKVRWL